MELLSGDAVDTVLSIRGTLSEIESIKVLTNVVSSFRNFTKTKTKYFLFSWVLISVRL